MAENLPDYVKDIIETEQFKRLKKVKQYGLISKLYPTANTNRYDHCLGTCSKALEMIAALEKNTNLEIPQFLKKCVVVAALLHDVGHGPFSHQWEFITGKKYKHEENAGPIVDQIFEYANIRNLIDEDDPRYGNSKELIKSFINGCNRNCLKDKEFRFLFEIVSNKQCGLDVDKWDYLQRDYKHARDLLPEDIKARMDEAIKFDDVFLKARVSNDRQHIEYRYCDFQKIYNIYFARQYFYIYFYQIPRTICLDQILKEIIVKNDNDLTINGMNILEIRSDNVVEFKEFHDDKIWSMIDELKIRKPLVEPLVSCLLNPNMRLTTAEDEAKIPAYLKVDTKINYPKKFMKINKMFFYGNESDKPKFPMEEGTYKRINYFQIKEL